MASRLDVKRIDPKLSHEWILNRHYAARLCPISYCFGGFVDDELVGIITYGTPVSPTLRTGLAGHEYASRVLELNRLTCINKPNYASQIIAKSLKLLPTPKIIVSYADTSQDHIGIVYQATNFIYTGLSAKRSDWKIKGMDLHSASIADLARGQPNRAQYLRDTYGDRFYSAPRPRKHRYVMLIGNKRDRKVMKKALKYPIKPYPKRESD